MRTRSKILICSRQGVRKHEYSRLISLSRERGPVAHVQTLPSNHAELEGVSTLICRVEKGLSQIEIDSLERFLARGSGLLVLLESNFPSSCISSVNAFLENHGVSGNSDCVIDTVWSKKSRHPKEAHVRGEDKSQGSLVFPEGCTLNVSAPAVCLRTTGIACYPFRRPVIAFSGGKLCVVGSSQIFSDDWIEVESNRALLEQLLDELMVNDGHCVRKGVEFSDYRFLCNTHALASGPMACLDVDEDEAPPESLARFDLFDAGLSLGEELGLIREKLGIPLETRNQPCIIRPKFSLLKINKVYAVHPPSLYPLLKQPELPLLDLDEMLTAPEVRLNRLANKCSGDSDEELEYFLVEAAKICLDEAEISPKSVLRHLFNSLV